MKQSQALYHSSSVVGEIRYNDILSGLRISYWFSLCWLSLCDISKVLFDIHQFASIIQPISILPYTI
jgi:hypothetical protein